MVKFVEICKLLNASSEKNRQRFTLREIYVNPKHVIALREDEAFKQRLAEGTLPSDLDTRQQFTKLTLDRGQSGLEIVVVGSPSTIESKLNIATTRTVLKG